MLVKVFALISIGYGKYKDCVTDVFIFFFLNLGHNNALVDAALDYVALLRTVHCGKIQFN